MEDFEKLEVLIAQAKGEAEKFYVHGNKTAGKRYRQYLMEIKKVAHGERNMVLEIKKGM